MILLQTLAGRDTVERWAEICQTSRRPTGLSEDRRHDDTRAIAELGNASSPIDTATGRSAGRVHVQPRRVLRPHRAGPTGTPHASPADAFLRALQRDVAWGFFYGIVNFDAVIGTVNHYGNVDLFAGRFNAQYRKAGLDYIGELHDRR